MADEGDFWREVKKERQEKKHSNEDSSIRLLKHRGIKYEVLSESSSHYRIGDWSFWPTTGKFYNPKTGKKGRGVRNLLKIIN